MYDQGECSSLQQIPAVGKICIYSTYVKIYMNRFISMWNNSIYYSLVIYKFSHLSLKKKSLNVTNFCYFIQINMLNVTIQELNVRPE